MIRQAMVPPLLIASQNGYVEIVKLLLSAKAKTSIPMKNGATPLFIASQNGHVEVVKLLLIAKAEIDAPMNDGITSLFIASQEDKTEVVRLLLVRCNIYKFTMGYRWLSFMRASFVVNCQQTSFCLAFRSAFHALSSFFNLSISPMRRFDKHWFPSADSSISAISSQPPCFGVWCISIRLASLRASAGSNASYKEAIL